MIWSWSLRDRVRAFVELATHGPWPQMREQAKRLLAALPEEEPLVPGARRRPERKHGGVDKSMLPFAPPRFRTRDDRNDERDERMSELRRVVLRRARGRCEFRCAVAGEPVEAHHVFGGSERRELESEYTLAAVCEDCHKRTEASPAWDRERSLAWARRMSADAQAAGDTEAATEFLVTAERLEVRIQLAALQARPITPKHED